MQGALIGLCLYLLVLGVILPQLVLPYSPHNPKKVYLHHTHHLVGGEGGLGVNHSTWDVVAIDSVPVRQALPEGLAGEPELVFDGAEHLNLFPVNKFMQVGSNFLQLCISALQCMLCDAHHF